MKAISPSRLLLAAAAVCFVSASVAHAERVLQTLHEFFPTSPDPGFPTTPLVEGNDGNFYGTTRNGGTNGDYGTIFKITPNGVLTTLFSFSQTNGYYPSGGLMLGSD